MAYLKFELYVSYYNNQIEITYSDDYIREWHAFYNIDEENSEKFINELQKKYQGSFNEMFTAAFGENFDEDLFCKFCEDNGIKYKFSSRIIV